MARGRLLVVSGPSGVGKTTLVAELLRRRPDAELSVSVTTRPQRAGEVDGVAYRFVDPDTFERLASEDAFLESATVHGARYGTPRTQVEEALAAGRTVVLEIDVQGAAQVKAAMPDAALVFIEPPSEEVLIARLTGRGTESDEAVQVRLSNARAELAQAGSFDHRVVNDDLSEAVEALIRILEAPRTPNHEENP